MCADIHDGREQNAPFKGPNTEAQDQLSPDQHIRLATHGRSIQKCHVWTAPDWQGKSSRRVAGRCSHVFGLFVRFHMTAGHNALRGSGPGQKPAFEMHWHMWVVLIAGSTGSALRAVRPPN